MKSSISEYLIARFCAVILIAAIPACTRTTETPAPPQSETADYLLSIQLLSDSPINLAPNARVRVNVWGYDRYVADVSATCIKSVIVPLKDLREPIAVPFSKEDLDTIEYRSGHENGLGYYIRVKLDTNGDGQTGPGDYGWDYKKTNMIFFDANQTGRQNIQIHLKEQTGTKTEPLE